MFSFLIFFLAVFSVVENTLHHAVREAQPAFLLYLSASQLFFLYFFSLCCLKFYVKRFKNCLTNN